MAGWVTAHVPYRGTPKAPVPPAGEKEMRKHLGVWGEKPQRVQGSALPPAAQARGAGAEPRWRRSGRGTSSACQGVVAAVADR